MGADYKSKAPFIIGGQSGDTNQAANLTRFHQIWGGRNQANEPRMVIYASMAMLLDRLYVGVDLAPGAGESVSFYLRREMATTLLIAQIAGAVDITATDLVNVAQIAAGDRIDIMIVTSLNCVAVFPSWCMRARAL